jgi:hypothetical protein
MHDCGNDSFLLISWPLGVVEEHITIDERERLLLDGSGRKQKTVSSANGPPGWSPQTIVSL